MPKRAGKKFLSIILCAALMLSCFSFALAEEAVPTAQPEQPAATETQPAAA